MMNRTYRLELTAYVNDPEGRPISCVYREANGDIHDSHHLDVLLAFLRAMDQRQQNQLDTEEK